MAVLNVILESVQTVPAGETQKINDFGETLFDSIRFSNSQRFSTKHLKLILTII